jgi:hypothetical protein
MVAAGSGTGAAQLRLDFLDRAKAISEDVQGWLI